MSQQTDIQMHNPQTASKFCPNDNSSLLNGPSVPTPCPQITRSASLQTQAKVTLLRSNSNYLKRNQLSNPFNTLLTAKDRKPSSTGPSQSVYQCYALKVINPSIQNGVVSRTFEYTWHLPAPTYLCYFLYLNPLLAFSMHKWPNCMPPSPSPPKCSSSTLRHWPI